MPRISRCWACGILVVCGIGCGREAVPPNSSPPRATSTSPAGATGRPDAAHAKIGDTSQASTPNETLRDNQPAKQAEQPIAAEVAPLAEKPAVETPRAAAMAAEILSKLDARKFPRLSATQVLTDSATHLYYSATASTSAAEAFYRSELETNGWKLVPSTIPENPQYVDRLYENNGFFARLTVYESGDKGVVGVSLSNLGNVNLTTLPRLPETELNPTSTPVNVNYNTTAGIASAAEACRQLFVDQGWQEYRDFTDPPGAPHVKQLAFRKNAVRVNLLVIRDPAIPNMDKTMVTYMAHHAMPCDLPVIDGATELQIDSEFRRAAYTTSAPVAAVVDYYRSAGQRIGWRPRADAESIQPESASLYVEDEPELGFGIQISRNEATTRVAFQRLSFADSHADSARPAVEDVAATAPESPEPASDEHDTDETVEDLTKEIKKQIRRELGKSGADLDKLGVDLEGLLGEDAEDDDHQDGSAAAEVPTEEKPAADPEPVDPAQLAKLETRCRVTYGDATYELKQVLAIRNEEDGRVTPSLMWSDKPLATDKARSLLARAKEVSLFDIEGKDSTISLELRLQESFAFVACFVDGASLNLGSSDIQTDFKVFGNRLRGTATLPKPTELADKPFRFEASFDVEFLAPGPAPAAGAGLAADAAYELPVPEDRVGISVEKSPFRQVLEAQVEAPLADVLKFYRTEAGSRKWKEDSPRSKTDATSAQLTFNSPEGPVTLSLRSEDELTSVTLSVRNEQEAKKQGMVPPTGKVRLVLGNATPAAVVITVDDRQHKLAAGQGEKDPAKALKIDLAPGKHKVSVQIDGETKSEEVTLQAGSAWGVIVVPDLGLFSNQLY